MFQLGFNKHIFVKLKCVLSLNGKVNSVFKKNSTTFRLDVINSLCDEFYDDSACSKTLFWPSGHVRKACDVLRSIEEFKHKSGMVSPFGPFLFYIFLASPDI